LKIPAPLLISNLDSTATQLKDKKEYFLGLDPAIADQKKKELYNNNYHAQAKPQKKSSKKITVKIDEEEFPEI
jgi:hypothetical protein